MVCRADGVLPVLACIALQLCKIPVLLIVSENRKDSGPERRMPVGHLSRDCSTGAVAPDVGVAGQGGVVGELLRGPAAALTAAVVRSRCKGILDVRALQMCLVTQPE